MKLITGLLLTLCFTVNAMAAKLPQESLSNLIEEYNYALSVEWDQKDKVRHAEIVRSFIHDAQSLLKSGEVTAADIQQVIAEKSGNARLTQDLAIMIGTLSAPYSTQQLVDFLSKNGQDLMPQGASWSPDPIALFFGGLLVLLLAWAIIGSATSLDEDCTYVYSEGDYSYYTCTLAN